MLASDHPVVSGTIIWGTLNLGIKTPSKTQNTIKQLIQRPHPGAVPSSMLARPILCRPKAHEVQCHHLCLHAQILSRFQKAQYALSPRPHTGVRLVRGLPNRGTVSASFENPPAAPSAVPRREGKLRLARDPSWRTETVTHPLSGAGAFITNHSTACCGCQTASVATQHSRRAQSPVRQLWSLCRYFRRCSSPVRTCRGLCGHA